ncbi:MAG: GyrI-like domain-containing protein [Saprospiraceae bacterium]
MKHEWRKKEKQLYLPKKKPEVINVPEFKFLTIGGEGSPANESFSEHIGALYAVAYAIKMTLKKETDQPKDYVDFTVYPLEGIWSLNEEAIKKFDGTINKEDFVFKLMIRQPDFVDRNFFERMLEVAKKKKANILLEKVKFEKIKDGKCIQMMHLGSFDNEPATFKIMEDFAEENNLTRLAKDHREIYLSDFRKVATEKLKTVLRFKIK